MRRPTHRQLAGLAVLGGFAAVGLLFVSPDAVRDVVLGVSDRPLAFALLLMALYLLRPLFAWPISPLSALVGYALGFPHGVPVALAGAVLTCLPPFFAARWLDPTTGLLGRFRTAGRRFVDVTGPTRGVLAARLSPVPADPVSYGAGFSGVSTRAFLVGTAVGEIPWVVLEVLAGASVHRIAIEGVGATGHVLVLSAALATLLLAGPAYRHLRTDHAF